MADHRVVRLAISSAAPNASNLEVARVDEAEVIEVLVHLGIELSLGRKETLFDQPAIEKLARLVDFSIFIVVHAIGPP